MPAANDVISEILAQVPGPPMRRFHPPNYVKSGSLQWFLYIYIYIYIYICMYSLISPHVKFFIPPRHLCAERSFQNPAQQIQSHLPGSQVLTLD